MGTKAAEQTNYSKDGKRFCRLHDMPLTAYTLTGAFLLTTYDTDYLVARDRQFPNAKWPEEGCELPTGTESWYCSDCQKLDDDWRTQQH